MKNTVLAVAIGFSVIACNDTAPKAVRNELLESELENAKKLFLQRINGDPKGTLPSYDHMQAVDTQFENLIANCDSSVQLGDMRAQLDICAEAVQQAYWPSTDLQDKVYKEVISIRDNIGNFNPVSLKERLLFIQLTYWNAFSDWPSRYSFNVDTVGTYVTNKTGKTGEVFRSPIAGVAFYTAENYRVITGTNFQPDGQLGGDVRELTTSEEHMPVYIDSTSTTGHHKIPAQLIATRTDGTPDTMNFYIEYDIK